MNTMNSELQSTSYQLTFRTTINYHCSNWTLGFWRFLKAMDFLMVVPPGCREFLQSSSGRHRGVQEWHDLSILPKMAIFIGTRWLNKNYETSRILLDRWPLTPTCTRPSRATILWVIWSWAGKPWALCTSTRTKRHLILCELWHRCDWSPAKNNLQIPDSWIINNSSFIYILI